MRRNELEERLKADTSAKIEAHNHLDVAMWQIAHEFLGTVISEVGTVDGAIMGGVSSVINDVAFDTGYGCSI